MRVLSFVIGLCIGCSGSQHVAAPGTAPASAAATGADQAPPQPAAESDPLAPSPRLSAMMPDHESRTVLPTLADLSGVWHEVPDNAAAGPFRRLPPCYEGLGYFAFEQLGDRVQMLRRFAEPAQGALLAYDIDQYERALGSRRDDAVELRGELVRETRPVRDPQPTRREVLQQPSYALTLDRGKGHLVGTRDGVAIRLAPLVLLTPPGDVPQRDRCGAPPP